MSPILASLSSHIQKWANFLSELLLVNDLNWKSLAVLRVRASFFPRLWPQVLSSISVQAQRSANTWTWPLAREWSTKDSFRYLTLQMNFITNDKSFISNTKPIYLRVGQCQIGNGERTWSVCQSTFKGKVTLGQKGRVGVPPWKDEKNLLEGRHNAQHFTYRQGKTPRQDFR